MDHTIVHFEIPADDVDRLTRFYGRLFGWKIEGTNVGVPPELDYRMVETVPTDEKGTPVRNGVNGAIYKRQDPGMRFTYYIQVESVDEHMKKIEELGGKVLGERTEVPNVGWVAFGQDPEGNPFAIFEAMPMG